MLLLLIAGTLYRFLFANSDYLFLEFLLVNFYSTVCHQQIDKSLSIGNNHMLVCTRCAGIYIGSFIASLVFFFTNSIQISIKILFISAALLIADVILVLFGAYEYTKIISFFTGTVFGAILYIYLMYELEQFLFASKTNLIK